MDSLGDDPQVNHIELLLLRVVENIAGLDISMDDVMLMKVLESLQELLHDLLDCRAYKFITAAYEAFQGREGQVLYHLVILRSF